MKPAASSARETYIEIANFVNMRRIAYMSRLRAFSIFKRHMVKYKQIQSNQQRTVICYIGEKYFFPTNLLEFSIRIRVHLV